ncbi:TIGR03899 family protein [Colwellia sp. 4_MG-2023]|uniref:TIGR03899 family protein n=1 Tax=unclassified Colwellia TaxID=196834 RepID=UPI0026E3DFDD|nr:MULTISPECIES: TIGR03899 family protein [unclassified Colwellia]MDO6508519.1 TIGR03899 family protein [Colwellia sp. 5_MG-2023]MDO6557134.1 TIGR03899 family protein [Colwellia sp. 4_MG-2023]
MGDIAGLGKGVEKLIDAVSNAIGVLYEPNRIRRQGDALAYKESAIAMAKLDSKANEITLITKAKIEAFEKISESKHTIQDRIAAKKEYKEYRKQINLEKVIEHGLNNVEENVSKEKVDDDWINKLTNYAENASTEKMQRLWGKVLAGEVSTPGSFSLKSLDILKNMTQQEADAFQRACSIASTLERSSQKVLINGYTSFSMLMLLPTFRHEFELNNYLSLPDLFALQAIGLIHNESLISGSTSYGKKVTVYNNDTTITAICKRTKIGMLTLKFTEAGNELSRLIPASLNDDYVNELKSSLARGFKFA